MEYPVTDIRNPLLREALIASVRAEALYIANKITDGNDAAEIYWRTLNSIHTEAGRDDPQLFGDVLDIVSQIKNAMKVQRS